MITLMILAVVFTSGAVAGIVALVCLSIGREESRSSLYARPPTRGAAATRRLLGWHGPAQAQAGRAAEQIGRKSHRSEISAATRWA